MGGGDRSMPNEYEKYEYYLPFTARERLKARIVQQDEMLKTVKARHIPKVVFYALKNSLTGNEPLIPPQDKRYTTRKWREERDADSRKTLENMKSSYRS
jgi:hypothetical protein